MYKAIVFDLDGTLLDTLEDITSAVKFALENNGLPPRTRAEVRSFVGNGIVNLMRLAAGKHGADEDKILSDFRAYYKAHCNDETKPYDGILSLLKTLKERGVKTAVLSNKADFATQMLVKEYFGELLDRAAGENEAAGIRRKPAPDALLAMMKELGVSQAETAYVGDSEVDIQTAKNAGVDCISVAWGFKDESFLKENGATTIAHSPSELLTLCEKRS